MAATAKRFAITHEDETVVPVHAMDGAPIVYEEWRVFDGDEEPRRMSDGQRRFVRAEEFVDPRTRGNGDSDEGDDESEDTFEDLQYGHGDQYGGELDLDNEDEPAGQCYVFGQRLEEILFEREVETMDSVTRISYALSQFGKAQTFGQGSREMESMVAGHKPAYKRSHCCEFRMQIRREQRRRELTGKRTFGFVEFMSRGLSDDFDYTLACYDEASEIELQKVIKEDLEYRKWYEQQQSVHVA